MALIPDIFPHCTLILVFLLISIGLFCSSNSHKLALPILLLTSILLRLFMASLDPFLHNWDERFHALVAKNMMEYPFMPMLRVYPILPYNVEDWSSSHIWVHKQPVFLWQMALSMKVFGVTEFAVRLPSVIMGTIATYFTYAIGKMWTKSSAVAYLSALLYTVSYFQLELISGRMSLDHNDIAFMFYVTASIWAFISMVHSKHKLFWSIAIGVFVGLAILNKWLPGLVVYGAWGLYNLQLNKEHQSLKNWSHILYAAIITALVVLPWQLYILSEFPRETAIMHQSNMNHILEDLDNSGSIWFHLKYIGIIYGSIFYFFIPIGIVKLLKAEKSVKRISISLLSISLVLYLFFSVLVKTKMPAFTLPVSAIMWIIIAVGINELLGYLKKPSFTKSFLIIVVLTLLAQNPVAMIKPRSSDITERYAKIHNAVIYRQLELDDRLKGRVILNCKSFEDIDLMFYQDVNAYHWFPTERKLDSLTQLGYEFAAFNDHNDQNLPDYIRRNPDIIILDEKLR